MTAMKLSARLLATHRTDHDAGAVMREAAAALDAAEAALAECADDLEAEIKGNYTANGKIFDQRRYDRDMEPVKTARTALALLRSKP